MKRSSKRLLIAALGLAPLAALASRQDDRRDWTYTQKETIEKSFDLSKSSEARRLLIDNMHGYIHVKGAAGNQIRVTVHKEIRARTQSALDEGKRDARLDVTQQGNFVRFYDDGPWRNHGRGDDYYGYRVIYDYDAEVPAAIDLELKGFNDKMEVEGTSGPFNLHGFNGGIEMRDMQGSGSVQTFNGAITARFRKNPERETTFKTFNGPIDVYFQPPFNADLHFKTFHGGVFADFDVAPLPVTVAAGQNLNTKYVYRSNGGGAARAGTGGPALRFDTFNGAIRLHTKEN